MPADTIIVDTEEAVQQGRVLLDGLGVAHDYLELFKDAVVEIAQRDGRVGLDGLGAMYSYAHRARVDVGQLSAWLDEVDAAIADMACGDLGHAR